MPTFGEIKQVRRLVDSSILRMPGVMAVATGFKTVKGKRTDELSLIIYVAKKLPLDRIPYFHAIPSSLKIRGVEVHTDIIEVGYYIPYTYDQRERPAKGGVSIGHLSVTAGTLGGLVCGPTSEENHAVLILSNNHVLAAINTGQKGDHIVQPGVHDGGVCHGDCIATLERFVSIDFTEGAVNYVDCAVALPYNSSVVSFEIHDIGFPSLVNTHALTQQDVINATNVQKTGRTTQHTVGYISAVDWKGTILYDWTPGYFENQIVVETLDGNPVGLGGDSGSLVLTMGNKICGLLFAGPSSGTHYIANHIGEVFNRLNVNLCCVTSEATSGSEAEAWLPELRRLRDHLRIDTTFQKYLDQYGKYAVKFLEAGLTEPQIRPMIRMIAEAIAKAIKDPRQKIDSKTIELATKLIDIVCEMERDDKEFLADMQKIQKILRKSADKTFADILKMLKREA